MYFYRLAVRWNTKRTFSGKLLNCLAGIFCSGDRQEALNDGSIWQSGALRCRRWCSVSSPNLLLTGTCQRRLVLGQRRSSLLWRATTSFKTVIELFELKITSSDRLHNHVLFHPTMITYRRKRFRVRERSLLDNKRSSGLFAAAERERESCQWNLTNVCSLHRQTENWFVPLLPPLPRKKFWFLKCRFIKRVFLLCYSRISQETGDAPYIQ